MGEKFYRAPPRGRMLFLSLNALERCIWARLRLESESVLILSVESRQSKLPWVAAMRKTKTRKCSAENRDNFGTEK